MKVKVTLDSLVINSRKSIIGEIYFEGENFSFPEKGWEDFVVIILAWWNKALLNLQNSTVGTHQEFDFMEGPLLVRGKKISEDIIKLEFIKEKRGGDQVFFQCDTSVDQLRKSLLSTTKNLLREIRFRNWQSEEIDELEKMYKMLK